MGRAQLLRVFEQCALAQFKVFLLAIERVHARLELRMRCEVIASMRQEQGAAHCRITSGFDALQQLLCGVLPIEAMHRVQVVALAEKQGLHAIAVWGHPFEQVLRRISTPPHRSVDDSELPEDLGHLRNVAKGVGQVAYCLSAAPGARLFEPQGQVANE